MNREQMIQQMKEQTGYSKEWQKSLDTMPSGQITAIYFRLKLKGIIK